MIYQIKNRQTGELILARARRCASFFCHLRGLMLRTQLDDDEGLLFITSRPSIINATIHMLFMFIPIGVVWLDAEWRVVDKKYAKPWRLAYAPAQAAQYYLEANPSILDRVQVGDVWVLENN